MKKNGFTLIELSIVLVIIGLIVGGVLAGRELIQQAKMRKVVSEINGLTTAINVFRTKYNCIPGDCPTATTFWGAASGGCPIPAWTGGLYYSPETCNGDGDGIVYGVEYMTFFAHLSNAELVDQKIYSGSYFRYIYNSNGTEMQTGLRSNAVTPTGTDGAGYGLMWNRLNGAEGVDGMNNLSFVRDDKNYLVLGAAVLTNFGNYGPVMAAVDAMGIDTKLDDGLPGKGRVQTWYQDYFNYWTDRSLPLCATTTDANTALYNIAAGDQINCALMISLPY